MIKLRMILLILLTVFGCSKKNETVKSREILAIIGQDTVFASSFKRFLTREGKTFQQLQTIQKKLTEFVHMRLIAQDGYANRLNETPEIIFRIRTKKDEFFYQKYIKEHVYWPLISENELREFYDKLKTEVRAKQILIKYVQEKEITVIDKSKRNLYRPEAKKLADSLYKELLKDPSRFSVFAEQFSDDVSSKFLNGDIGYIRYSETDSEFEKILFSLNVGGISEPVQTGKGFHIITISERRSAETLKPFVEAREGLLDMLVSDVTRNKKKLVSEKLAALTDSILKSSGFKIQKANVNVFLNRYSSIASPADIVSAFDTEQLALPLAIYQNGQIQILELALAMKENATKIKMNVQVIQNGLASVAAKRIISEIAQKVNYTLWPEENIFLKSLEEDLMQNLSLRKLYEDVSASDEDIRKYYDNNKENYREPAFLDIQEISSKELMKLNPIADAIRSGGDFDSVFNSASKTEGLTTMRTGLIPYNPKDYMIVNAATMKPGENSEPFQNIQGGFSMIRLVEKKEGQYLPFETVKNKVIMDGLNFKRQMMYNEWIANLSVQYKVQIFSDRLKDVFDVKLK